MHEKTESDIKTESDKKLLPTFLLCFFLGGFGAHRFYVGKIATAIVMLVLTLTFVGVLVTSIWAIVDLILILTGNLRDKDNLLIKSWS